MPTYPRFHACLTGRISRLTMLAKGELACDRTVLCGLNTPPIVRVVHRDTGLDSIAVSFPQIRQLLRFSNAERRLVTTKND